MLGQESAWFNSDFQGLASLHPSRGHFPVLLKSGLVALTTNPAEHERVRRRSSRVRVVRTLNEMSRKPPSEMNIQTPKPEKPSEVNLKLRNLNPAAEAITAALQRRTSPSR